MLGDGAEWIWNAAPRQFGDCHQVLDIYHAAHYISDAGKGLFGDKTPAATAFLEEGRGLLLSDGWAGLCDHIGATLAKSPELAGHAALAELTGYFAAHTERLNYCHRLHTGQSIGSGMVEGAAKNLVGRRLKQTGASLASRERQQDGRVVLPYVQCPLGLVAALAIRNRTRRRNIAIKLP